MFICEWYFNKKKCIVKQELRHDGFKKDINDHLVIKENSTSVGNVGIVLGEKRSLYIRKKIYKGVQCCRNNFTAFGN